uniref:Uncharacterized protein n=1 Tax=Siphoviridae sp. ctvph17 TaxID=2825724 RepID=A0A8S5UJS7_9CAUD|nr:MAG TPA: hypothetical protein [Siphoviridae sp. ctvph17]
MEQGCICGRTTSIVSIQAYSDIVKTYLHRQVENQKE